MPAKQILPNGSLDLEQDPLYIKQGDYRAALDITPITNDSGNTNSIENVLGNEFSYSLGEIVPQTKVVQITLPLGTGTFDFYVKRPNYIYLSTSVTFAGSSNPVTLYNNASAAILSAITGSNVSASTASPTSITFTLDIGGVAPYVILWDWTAGNNTGATLLASFITLQEAIGNDAAGKFKPIAFFDLLGEQFYWGATVSETPLQIPVTAVSNDGTGLVQLTCANNGIIDGSAISVTGVVDGAGNNLTGEWMAYKVVTGGLIDPDKIVLVGSTYTPAYTLLSNAAITVNYTSVGMIGVATQDAFSNTTTALNLIQSKVLNFRTKKQVHAYVETDTKKKSFYYTDNFNPIRAMYYNGAYMFNGFLSTVNPLGVYTFDDLNEETKLFSGDTNALIDYTSTNDTGGILGTGNYRYTCRFITDFGQESPWLPLTGPINIFSSVVGGGATIQTGNPDGDISGKSNILSVTGIFNQFYKYIELGYVLYQGIGESAYSTGQQLITGSTMVLTHTGRELTTPIDLGTLVSTDTNAQYVTAKSIDALNNRLIISNLKSAQVSDFSAFFETFEHSLINEQLPDSYGVNNAGGETGAGVPGNIIYNSYGNPEYFNPDNTCHKKGFVHNETYRFGARVKLKNGKFLSNIFWIDDIRIDTNATNIANPTNPNRRIAGLTGYEICNPSSDHANALISTVVFSNIDWNYIIDGYRIIDLVERIYIYQVEMVDQYKEVLGTGLYFLHTSDSFAYTASGSGFSLANSPVYSDPFSLIPNSYGEFNAFTGNSQMVAFRTDYTTYDNIATGQKYIAFHSPDDYFSIGTIQPLNGDAILTCDIDYTGIFDIDLSQQALNGAAFTSKFVNTFGAVGGTTSLDSSPVSEGYYIGDGNNKTFTTGDTIIKLSAWGFEDTSGNAYNPMVFANQGSIVVYSPTPAVNVNAEGFGYAQYYRFKGYYLKFGDKATSTYIPTGAHLDAPIIATTDSVTVYGDAFVQGSYAKLRTPPPSPYSAAGSFHSISWGLGMFFYSQNRVNSQMRYPTGGISNENKIAPGFGASGWGRPNGDPNYVETLYTHSYDDRCNVQSLAAFDPNLVDITLFPTRIAYSQNKPNGSTTDEYRKFLLADCRDLEQVNGEINHHAIVNGELLTWQQRSFQRQYFQSNGMFPNLNGSEIILGDGSALSRRGLSLSNIGSKNKWSIIKGVSKGGNDVVAWVNTEYGYVVRFGYDGVNPISQVHNINSFIDKNTTWVDGKDTPADDEGIHGVWNDERKEYIWTVRGRRNNKGLFNPENYYAINDVVYAYTDPTSQLPVLYTALQVTKYPNGTAVDVADTAYWAVDTNKKHRNEYTLCFNEIKNGFTCNYSFIPKIYGKWKKGYVSGITFVNTNFTSNGIYLHNQGTYNSWYSNLLTSSSYITGVMNEGQNTKKDFVAIELNSQTLPRLSGNAMEFLTEQHFSYLVQSDFSLDELHDIMWSSHIKNDATITAANPSGLNDIDTSSVFGEYLLWTFFYEPFVYNKLFGVTLKYQPRTRLNNS